MSNFSRSLEMPLIHCKIELSLKGDPNCILSNLVAMFTITDIKVLSVLTLLIEDNTKLSKQLSEGFKWFMGTNTAQFQNKTHNTN